MATRIYPIIITSFLLASCFTGKHKFDLFHASQKIARDSSAILLRVNNQLNVIELTHHTYPFSFDALFMKHNLSKYFENRGIDIYKFSDKKIADTIVLKPISIPSCERVNDIIEKNKIWNLSKRAKKYPVRYYVNYEIVNGDNVFVFDEYYLGNYTKKYKRGKPDIWRTLMVVNRQDSLLDYSKSFVR